MNKLVPILIGNKQMIQLSQLTMDQANNLRNFLPGSSIKKMTYKGMELHDCIEFETYKYWLQSHHQVEEETSTIWDI